MVETTLGLRTLSSLDATKNEMWQENVGAGSP